jgi:hypothetical protein
MPSFKVRDLTVNISATPQAGCDENTIACFNAASVHPTRAFLVPEGGCDNGTIACFNAASIHPSHAVEMIAAVRCDSTTVACFNAASVHPPDIVRAAVPTSGTSEDLAALKTELREALARLDENDASRSGVREPQTLAEVEMLQQRLSDALADLSAKRQALERGRK